MKIVRRGGSHIAEILRMNPKLAPLFAFSRPSCKTDARLLTATSTSDKRLVEGLIRPFSLAFGRTPSVGCYWMHDIENV